VDSGRLGDRERDEGMATKSAKVPSGRRGCAVRPSARLGVAAGRKIRTALPRRYRAVTRWGLVKAGAGVLSRGMPFAIALVVLSVAWRIMALYFQEFSNFAPLMALAFCGAV
jgi:hypothetical protein